MAFRRTRRRVRCARHCPNLQTLLTWSRYRELLRRGHRHGQTAFHPLSKIPSSHCDQPGKRQTFVSSMLPHFERIIALPDDNTQVSAIGRVGLAAHTPTVFLMISCHRSVSTSIPRKRWLPVWTRYVMHWVFSSPMVTPRYAGATEMHLHFDRR